METLVIDSTLPQNRFRISCLVLADGCGHTHSCFILSAIRKTQCDVKCTCVGINPGNEVGVRRLRLCTASSQLRWHRYFTFKPQKVPSWCPKHTVAFCISIPSRMACSSQPFSVKDDVLCHRPDIALFSSRVVYLQLFPGPIPHDIPNHKKPFLVSQEISIIRPRNQGIIMIATVRYITQSYKLTLHLLFIWELLMTSLGSVGQLEGFMRFVLSINATGILRVLLHEPNYSPWTELSSSHAPLRCTERRLPSPQCPLLPVLFRSNWVLRNIRTASFALDKRLCLLC